MQYSSPSRQSLVTLAWLARQMFYRSLVRVRVLVHILSRQSLLTLAWIARKMFYKLLVKSRVLGHGVLCGSDPTHPGLLQLACPIRCVPASFLVLCPGWWMFHMTLFMSPRLDRSIPVRAARAFRQWPVWLGKCFTGRWSRAECLATVFSTGLIRSILVYLSWRVR
jgi:hypothetical protein